jgi:hypothetical protein
VITTAIELISTESHVHISAITAGGLPNHGICFTVELGTAFPFEKYIAILTIA